MLRRSVLTVGAAAFVAIGGALQAAPQLTQALAFGSRNLNCPTLNDPGVSYTMVFHGTVAQLQYDAARGWGYEILRPGDTTRNGYGVFGPFDESPNNRAIFPDTCPEQLYDSFIGAKNFVATCNQLIVDPPDPNLPCSEGGLLPDGIIFRVDVPNGKYRFVAACGSADNRHATRIVVEDGGEGPPENIGTNYVVLVSNYDQAEHGTGVFARVGFGCFIPPAGNGPRFLNMDSEGLVTDGPPSSPTLEVTQGYLRVHQLQANSNDGAAGVRDPNGGNMVILEIWSVGEEVIPDGVLADVVRSIDPDFHAPGGTVPVTLNATGVTAPVTIVETLPAGYSVDDAGGGVVAGNTIRFNLAANGSVSYTVRTPAAGCAIAQITGEATAGGCSTTVSGESELRCSGALSPTGAVLRQLIIGPVDLGANAGPACDDTGRLATTDYFTDGGIGESNVLVREGDTIFPDFGGQAGGIGVKAAANPAINPDAAIGGLTVWTASADTNGLIDFNLAQNIGNPVDDYIVYSLTYVENLGAGCRSIVAEVGSDDAVKVIFNGEVVHTNSICRGVPAAGLGDRVPISLLPGKNALLVGVVERAGGTGVRVVLRNPDDTPVTDGGVLATLEPPALFPSSPVSVDRTIDPTTHGPGDVITVRLEATGILGATTIVETLPAAFSVSDAGGGVAGAGTLTFAIAANTTITYKLSSPADSCECGLSISGQITGPTGCKAVTGDNFLRCRLPSPTCAAAPEDPAVELIQAFAFGVHGGLPVGDWCTSFNDPAVPFTLVEQIDPISLEYTADKGFGYEVILPGDATRAGYGVYGPFDDTPNARNKYPDACAEELYDSMIGGKNFTAPCTALQVGNPNDPCASAGILPEGIIFRIDVPNGKYRFVGAFGDADNVHAHRILAEDGGVGPPSEIGPNHVVLVGNFDQAQQSTGDSDAVNLGEGVFARVGFSDKIPPPGDDVPPSPQFVNMDESGQATVSCPNSPTLEVTQGYVRIHQLQANSNAGCGGPGDPNGGDIVLLELWRIVPEPIGTPFHRGDGDNNGKLELTDAVKVLGYLFLGASAPDCFDAADSDDNGRLELTDAVRILGYLFLGAPPPAPPGPPDTLDCGVDPTTDDALDCGAYPAGNC